VKKSKFGLITHKHKNLKRMYDQDHPFYLGPYPESQDQGKEESQKDFEESVAQAFRNVIILVAAFILIGISYAAIQFLKGL
jgi:hypothetical protein